MASSVDVHINRSIHTVGTRKMCSLSESSDVHLGGVEDKQNSLEGTGAYSVYQDNHKDKLED